MTTFTRLIRTAVQAGSCRRQRDYLTDIISGPDTTYRSELIEAMSGTRVSE
jgi:DNA polymerase/3'-5' exonuclease PolX